MDDKNTRWKWLRAFTEPLVLITLTLSITTMIFAYSKFFSDDFWKFKFIDIIAALGQVATAAAFILGFAQYNSNKKKDRQLVLSVECQRICQEMVRTIKTHATAAAIPSHLDQALTRLCNQAGDFFQIYNAMGQDTMKDIVRIHWQDMYFNEFLHFIRTRSHIQFATACGWDNSSLHTKKNQIHLSLLNYDEPKRSSVEIELLLNCDEFTLFVEPLNWKWLDLIYPYFFSKSELVDLFDRTTNTSSMFINAPLIFALYNLRMKALQKPVLTHKD